MITLQVELAETAVDKAFSVDPTTVYGVLVGLLVTLIAVLLVYSYKKDNRHRQAMIDLVDDHKKEVAMHYDDLKQINTVTTDALTSNREKLANLITLVQSKI